MAHMTQEQVKLELNRRQSKTQRLLKEFIKEGELTTRDLQKYGTGCSSRLKELRKEGHRIVARAEKPGFWRYTYVGQIDNDDNTQVAVVD